MTQGNGYKTFLKIIYKQPVKKCTHFYFLHCIPVFKFSSGAAVGFPAIENLCEKCENFRSFFTNIFVRISQTFSLNFSKWKKEKNAKMMQQFCENCFRETLAAIIDCTKNVVEFSAL